MPENSPLAPNSSAASIAGRAVDAVSWHPDGRRIAVATDSARVRVYDVSGKVPLGLLTVEVANAAHMAGEDLAV